MFLTQIRIPVFFAIQFIWKISPPPAPSAQRTNIHQPAEPTKLQTIMHKSISEKNQDQ